MERSTNRPGDRLVEAAIEAERETAHHVETDEEARRGVVRKFLRMFAGFFLVGVGIAGLALPGPGWVVIILGLSMLPFAWAERTVRLIRRKVPGVPEDGRIPTSTWVLMGVLMVCFTAGSILFGDAVTSWVSELWGDPDKLLT